MSFELNPGIFDYYDKSFPTVDLGAAFERRKNRELLERRLNQEKEIRDRESLEKAREFNLRAGEWGGQDLVKDELGNIDPAATAKAKGARLASEAMMGEAGVQSVLNPKRLGDEFAGPFPGQNPTESPILPPTKEQAASAEFWNSRTKALEEERKRKADLERVAAQFGGRQALRTSADVGKMHNWLLANDPEYSPTPYMDQNGVMLPEVASAIADRYNTVAPRANLIKQMPPSARIEAMSNDLLSKSGMTEDEIAKVRARSGPVVEQKANQFIESVKKSLPEGRELKPNEEADLRQKFLGGGVNAINAPQNIVKDVTEEATNVRQLDTALKSISEFNSKYGPNAFDQFVGPYDNRMNKLRAEVIEPSKRTQAEKDARQVFQKVEQVVQNYRKAQFGTALSANESKMFKNIVSDPTFADYANQLGSFASTLKERIRNQVGDYELAPNIPSTIKNEFFRDQAQPAAAPAQLTTEQRRARIAELRAKLGQK